MAKAVNSGRLLRLRRGVYIEAELWMHAHPAQRYQLMIAATGRQLQAPVFCRESALQVHGLPLLAVPQQVHIRASSAGAVRRARQTPMTGTLPVAEFWNRAASRGAAEGLTFSSALFRGFSTARHPALAATVAEAAPSQEHHLRLPLPPPGGTATEQIGVPVRVEPLHLALVDTLHRLPFDQAVVTLEAALRRGQNPQLEPVQCQQPLRQLADQLIRSQRAGRYFQNLLDFASPLPESPGESLARARFQQLGFVQPQLQVGMNIDGTSYRVDFLWEEAGVVGEFDGWQKYDDDDAANFSRSLRQEKVREDAIRSTGLTVVRFYWQDLMEPGCKRLIRLLTRAGVPRT